MAKSGSHSNQLSANISPMDFVPPAGIGVSGDIGCDTDFAMYYFQCYKLHSKKITDTSWINFAEGLRSGNLLPPLSPKAIDLKLIPLELTILNVII